LRTRSNSWGGSYDANPEYSNRGHVDQVGVTNSENVEAVRRSTRKRLKPNWGRDFVNMDSKDGERETSGM